MGKRIQLRISEEKKNTWMAEAKKQNSTLTQFIFNKVDDEYSIKDIRSIEKSIDNIVYFRNKVDVNINQIARNINLSKNVSELQMLSFLELLGSYNDKVNDQNKLIIKIRKDLNTN